MKSTGRVSTEAWIAVAAFVCFIIIGLLEYRSQQRVVQGYDTFSSYDYQSGGYHAWYDLLQREGVHVERFQRRPAYISDAVSTLIIANNAYDALLRASSGQPAGFFQSGDFEALSRWVKHGGQLVWLVDSETSNGLARSFSRRAGPARDQQNGLHLPALVESDLKKDEAIAVVPSSLTSGVHAVAGNGTGRIPFADSAAVVPLIADDTGATVVSYPLGKGSVVVVSDESLFENSRLTQADNARLAFNLAQVSAGGTVAFEEWSHGYQTGDTWWTILPKPMQWAVLIFCGAMLLALAGSALRFGPAARLAQDGERTSEEYVNSMAALMQRARAARKAVRELAQLGHHHVAQALGLPDSVPAVELAQRLRASGYADWRADAVIELDRLAGYDRPSAAELVRAADICFSLRKEFQSHAEWRRIPRRPAQRRSA